VNVVVNPKKSFTLRKEWLILSAEDATVISIVLNAAQKIAIQRIISIKHSDVMRLVLKLIL